MKTYNFNTPWNSDYWMESNGFFCGFNMPDALITTKENDMEIAHQLPPYKKRSSFLVEDYASCPKTWMKSQGKLTSFFVPIQEGKGMWLDFNKNSEKQYDVAIVVSIQGVNAITGLPCNDHNLEQYSEKCPKHKILFGANRFCSECGYNWSRQNYLCTTGTPNGELWLDGFRAANGAIQQYILTEQTMKGVASNIIGEQRVYAIGISYFYSKYPKTRTYISDPDNINVDMSILNTTPYTFSYPNYKDYYNDSTITCSYSNQIYTSYNCNLSEDRSIKSLNLNENCIDKISHLRCKTADQTTQPIKTKNIEIGAGARISQQIYDDPNPLDYWKDQPEAILCINYCLEEECQKILDGGKITKNDSQYGFLKNIPCGN